MWEFYQHIQLTFFLICINLKGFDFDPAINETSYDDQVTESSQNAAPLFPGQSYLLNETDDNQYNGSVIGFKNDSDVTFNSDDSIILNQPDMTHNNESDEDSEGNDSMNIQKQDNISTTNNLANNVVTNIETNSEIDNSSLTENVYEDQKDTDINLLPQLTSEKNERNDSMNIQRQDNIPTNENLEKIVVINLENNTELDNSSLAENVYEDQGNTNINNSLKEEKDICSSATMLDNFRRSYKSTSKLVVDDRDMESGWYAFKIESRHAKIVEKAIKPGHCGTEIPYHIESFTDKDEAFICGTMNSEHGMLACVKSQKILKKDCGSYIIYKLDKIVNDVDVQTGICIQENGELLKKEYLAFPDDHQYPYNSLNLEELKFDQLESVATLELEYIGEESESYVDWRFISIEDSFRERLAYHLNNPTLYSEGGDPSCTNIITDIEIKDIEQKYSENTTTEEKGLVNVKKRDINQECNKTHILFISPTPLANSSGVLQLILLVKNGDDLLKREDLVKALQELNDTDFLKSNKLKAVAIYPGIPKNLEDHLSILMNMIVLWDRFWVLFITLAALILISIIIITIICTISCRNEEEFSRLDDVKVIPVERNHWPLAISNPITDEEIMRTENFSLVIENDSITYNSIYPDKCPEETDERWMIPGDAMTATRL